MKNRCVLVIEDELLVGLDVVEVLEGAGFGCVEHAATEDEARQMLETKAWDAVIADANLNGRSIEGVVHLLHEKGLPFLIVSGYERQSLPAVIGDAPVLGKPVSYAQMLETVKRLCRVL